MQITIADDAGACYGVDRAIRIADAQDMDSPVFTLGPLIHNPQVVSRLEERGIRSVEEPEDVKSPATLIIRSHGVAPKVVDRAIELGLDVVDATCPYVSKAQHAAEELAAQGRLVIVVGDAGHPEVEGIVGHAGPDTLVVASAAEIPDSLPDRLGVVVQTTQSHETFDEVVNLLSSRDCDLKVIDTICLATQKRQQSAARLANEVDAMVVVGGRNSGNTRRLYEICSSHCERVHHVESADELSSIWFDGCNHVGITAGASTPASQIDDVVARLRELPGL